MISAKEHYILSYYRAGELSGSLLMGRLAMHTSIDSIRIPLTRHCMEEAKHAWMWTQTIEQLGMKPLKVSDTFQSEYGRAFGIPKSTLEILCLAHVLERRVVSLFEKHLERPDTHPLVQETLKAMIAQGNEHLGWVWDVLDGRSNSHKEGLLAKTLERVEEIDEELFSRMVTKSPFDEYYGESSQDNMLRHLAVSG